MFLDDWFRHCSKCSRSCRWTAGSLICRNQQIRARAEAPAGLRGLWAVVPACCEVVGWKVAQRAGALSGWAQSPARVRVAGIGGGLERAPLLVEFQLSNRPRLQRTPTTFLDQRCSTLHWSGATSRGLHFSMPAALCEPPRVYDPPAEGEPPKRRDATRGDQRTERPHTYGVRTSTDQSGVPHIQRACTRGDVATVVKLLRAGVDCGCETEAGLNLLHLVACGSGSVDVARKLLQVAPDLAARKCNRGWTPLMHAGSEGNWAICELLEGRRP